MSQPAVPTVTTWMMQAADGCQACFEAGVGWQQELARTITNRGQDFSDAIGNLPAFSTDAT